jgi:hypothetical protein
MDYIRPSKETVMGRVLPAVCLLASLLLLTPGARGVALAQKPPGTGGAAAPTGKPGSAEPGRATSPSAPPTNEPTQRTPAFGGGGGTAFELRCGQGYVLTGLQGRQGMVIDRIGVLCRPVRSDGSLGSETTVGGQVGAGGGNPATVSCGSGRVVSALYILYGTYVDSVQIGCRTWHPGTRSTSGTIAFGQKLGGSGSPTPVQVSCGSDRQPGAGILGRAGGVVDSIGLVCNEP